MRINFQEISFKKTKRGLCDVCGKRGQLTRKFYQTINPWNNKTPEQILNEEKGKAAEWLAESFKHEKCK